MCITEYDEEKTLKGRYREGFEEGRLELLAELVKKGLLTLVQAASEAEMTEKDFAEVAKLQAYL